MRKEIIFIIGLILSISFVLAIPPQPNAFYGTIEYDGESIPGGCSLEVRLNDFSEQCLITNKGYGYDTNTCIVLDEENSGGVVEFYLESVKIGEHTFEALGITNLDFAIDFLPDCSTEYCGDGICNNAETCSTCPVDCGACSSGDDDSSGGGGGGGGGGGSSSTSNTVITYTEPDNNGGTSSTNPGSSASNTQSTLEEKEIKSSGITGAIIGFAKSGFGIGLIIAILVLAVGVVIMVSVRKKEPEKKKSKKNK